MSGKIATMGPLPGGAVPAAPSDEAMGPVTLSPSGFGGVDAATAPEPSATRLKWRGLLGRDPKTRRFLVRTMIGSLPYAAGMLTALYCARLGEISPARAYALIAGMAATLAGIYTALRSGWTYRFNDPSISLAQILIAMSWIAVMYALTGRAHAAQLPMLALTMAAAVFNLDMRGARLSCAFGVMVMTVCIPTMTHLQPQAFTPRVQFFHWVIVASTLPTIMLMGAQLTRLRLRLKTERGQLEQALSRLNKLATHDDLTGLSNRAHMREMLEHYLQRHHKSGEVFSIALLDLDHFKRINDTHGHGVGDEVLQAFAHETRQTLREIDLIARWGGEEFLVLFPQSTLDQALVGMERLRARLGGLAVSASVPDLRVMFSAGMASADAAESLSLLLERADRALYAAKSAGRNQCVCDRAGRG